jgi:DNA (cytosine-5)-methyltransferase 1
MATIQVDQDTLDRIAADVAAALENDQQFLRKTEAPRFQQAPDAVEIVDLFCGCGGLTYGALEGLERAGRSGIPTLVVDRDPLPLEVLRKTLSLDNGQVKDWDLGTLQEVGNDPTTEETVLFSGLGQQSLLVAGPPCQGHSALNNHTRHDDPRNDLYMAVARAAELLKPRAVISENVGSVSSDRTKAVSRCVEALKNLDYEVVEKRLDLSVLGVPQRRVRHIVIATKDKCFDWDRVRMLPPRDVAWAIEDLLACESTSVFNTSSQAHEKNRERIDWLFDEDEFDLPNSRRPDCHQDGNHSYLSMYGRLHWDRPAQTITSGFGSMGQGRFVHPRRRRTLTPHEAARLQCLPDFVAFESVSLTRSALATMIGNVAPPLLATRVVEAMVGQQLL